MKKYLSRKFIVTIVSAIAGIVIAIVGHAELVQSIAACAMIVLPAIAYTITEGKIDAENVKTAGDAIENTLRENGKETAANIAANITDAAVAAAECANDKDSES